MRARALLAGLLLLAAAGCGTPDHVRLSVTPGDALYDAPLTARVDGLNVGEPVRLTLTLPDHVQHLTWRSRRTVTADADGRLATRLDRWIGTMRPTQGGEHYFVPAGSFTMTLTVDDGGHRLASRTVRRQTPQSAGLVTTTRLRPGHGGLYADLYEPTKPTGTASAVVVWGGSEGGLGASPLTAAMYAAHGHPALALAYFHEKGLPQKLLRIPIEYFGAAVRRLQRAPNVDPHRVFVAGISRGSEAAALTALHYPTLVHGVVDEVPSSVANRALGASTPLPAWTVGGKDVPPALVQGDPDGTGAPGSKFEWQRYPGLVLAVCGTKDEVWPSCPFADAIRAEDPSHVTVLRYRGAGHRVGDPVPYLPTSTTKARALDGRTVVYGGTIEADAAGKADLWPKVLAFVGS